MKKWEIILFAVIAAACIAFLAVRYLTREEGATVVVEVNGEEFGTYSLNKDQEIDINGTNVLIIADGGAFMSQADCPDKLCISQGVISSNGQMIICLPNRVFVQVIDEQEDDGSLVDAVAE